MYYIIIIAIQFFFFQAEDGIRDTSVTGVQTCALPIFERTAISPPFPTSNAWTSSSPSTTDRKSTRLNSSHRCISYAVFCLKKKKEHKDTLSTQITKAENDRFSEPTRHAALSKTPTISR